MAFFNKWIAGDESSYSIGRNRNKDSLTIGIKSEEGKVIISRVAKKTDVVVKNFRLVVIKRLGYTYKDLKK